MQITHIRLINQTELAGLAKEVCNEGGFITQSKNGCVLAEGWRDQAVSKDQLLRKQTVIDVQQRTQVESKRLKDEQKSLALQMRDDHTKLQAIVANPKIASNLPGLSEIES